MPHSRQLKKYNKLISSVLYCCYIIVPMPRWRANAALRLLSKNNIRKHGRNRSAGSSLTSWWVMRSRQRRTASMRPIYAIA